ncbi:MAG: dienelactone hydrolase family protein [Armatimonadota bacterium]|nr:dienelactone hydrolase family protein [Armatimonadota bacterium]
MPLIKSDGGVLPDRLDAYSVRPDGPGPFPGLVLIHEIVGLNANIRAIADRFAGEGYVVLAVDLFTRRNGLPLCILRYICNQRFRPFDNADINDLRMALTHLEQQPGVDKSRLGAVGFCMGGGYAIAWACTDNRLRAIAPFYGINPHPVKAVRDACPVVASYPKRDRVQHTEKAGHLLEAALESFGIPHDVVFYPGTNHSFWNLHPNTDVQEHSWERMIRFFNEHL